MFEPPFERVFIVEDNELMLRLYRSVLGSLGYESGHASTAGEARRLLSTRRPDLIIVDDLLPDGSGEELTRSLRSCAEFAHTPIVAVASDASDAARDRMRNAGCTQFLSKPIQIGEFSAAARQYLSPGAA